MSTTPEQIQAARDDLARFEHVPADGSQREWRPVAAESLRVALAAMGDARDNADAAEELAREADAERKTVEADLAALRIEHALHVDLLAVARRERDEARAQLLDANEELTRTAKAIHGEPADAHMLHEAAEDLVRERDELRAHLRRVLDCERAAAAHRGLSGCTCMAQSRAAEQAYEMGKCPHQLADAALAGSKS